jgi:hypothetical protein
MIAGGEVDERRAMTNIDYGISAITAKNIERLRLTSGMTRPEFRERLNKKALVIDEDFNGNPVLVKAWTDARVIALEHGQEGREPALTVEGLYAVCSALGTTVFDVLLPDESSNDYKRVSKVLLGFEASPEIIAALARYAHLGPMFRYHPDVVSRAWDDTVEYWTAIRDAEQIEIDNGDPDTHSRLMAQAFVAERRADQEASLQVDRILARLARPQQVGESATVPSHSDAVNWRLDYELRTAKLRHDIGLDEIRDRIHEADHIASIEAPVVERVDL